MRSPAVRSTFSGKSFRSPNKKHRVSNRASLLDSGSGKSNLWTFEERADLYNRRQNGEDWESICKDYPSRSRHAMQQQYSVEKKKHVGEAIDLRIGRRGGRKPRAATRGHNWTSINKRPASSDEEVDDSMGLLGLDEDDADTDYEDIGNAAEEESSQAPEEENPPDKARISRSPRPPPLARSATEPTTRQKAAKKAMFPNLPASAGLPPQSIESPPTETLSNKRKTPMNEASETESRTSSHQSKRPKYSTEPSETYPTAQRSESTPLAASKPPLKIIKLPELIFTAEDVARAQVNAREMSNLYETDKNNRQEAHEAAQKRAIRRANDAETRENEAIADYARRLKLKDSIHAQELGALKEQVQQARADAQAEQEKQGREIATLTASLEALKTGGDEGKSQNSGDTGLLQKVERQEEQLKLYDQLRNSINSEIEKPMRLRGISGDKAEVVKVQHDLLTSLIGKIHDEVEDMSSKAIIRSLKEIRETNEALLNARKEQGDCMAEMWEAVDSFVKPFKSPREPVTAGNNTNTEAAASEAVASTEVVEKPSVPAINTAVTAAAPTASASPRKRTAK